jgi:NAD(P)-dependent dehydrogenase (short-subunit alcohol dehydrogenase family)
MSQAIKSVIITGSNGGIGSDIARRFLELGSSVIINGRNEEKLEKVHLSLGHKDRVISIAGDVSDPETGKRLAQAAIENFGGIDVLVNNAGQFGVKTFLETTAEDLDQYYYSNLRGTFFTSQAVVPEMIKARRGSIISIGTVLVNHGMASAPVTGPMTSKGGIHALSVSLAAELAKDNIRVNVVAPGIIRTPLIGEGADSFAPIHPLGRIGEVEDISNAVAYLAQADFVTGTVLEVDGGYTHGR